MVSRDAPWRIAWIAYLRVSTAEQAERALSLPAQRRAIDAYASTRGARIAREYVEAGCSGTNPHRPAFRRMLEDAFRPGSDVGAIVVHHTSRFTRDAAEARVVKSKLRRIGVRVLSVSQELSDDPMGKLMEGLFECIDQYESELNGVRTAAAMAECVRQGYFPSPRPPFGYQRVPVEIRPRVVRHKLVPNEAEARIVREIFRLYITRTGAKAVARELNERGLVYRTGARWTKDLVLNIIDGSAVAGTCWWGRRRAGRPRAREEWLPLKIEPIVEADVYALAKKLRSGRDPTCGPGRASAAPHIGTGLLRCGRCGASYQLETSGKRVDGGVYRYCYYNCRSYCRSGREVCPGLRIPIAVLDAALLAYVADRICAPARVEAMRRTLPRFGGVGFERRWRAMIVDDVGVGRAYLLHLVESVEVHDGRLIVTPREGPAPQLASAT